MFINGFEIYISNVHLHLKDRFIPNHKKITLNDEICITCNNCDSRNLYCKKLHTYQTNNYDFVCDFYRRKCSGSYRRKRAKYNKGLKNE